MKLFRTLMVTLIAAGPSLLLIPSAQAVECPVSGTAAGWGSNWTGAVMVPADGNCLMAIRVEGVFTSSKILTPPQHGKLKRINMSTFEYTPTKGYRGNDTFSVQASGKGQTTSGTSVINMTAMVQ